MNRTEIEWVKNPDGTQGYTWNPITGCLNHDNGLCKGGGFPCYAYKLAHGRLKQTYMRSGAILPPSADLVHPSKSYREPFYPRFWEERLAELTRRNDRLYYDGLSTVWKNRMSPKGIFVCDMGDLFGIGVPKQWTEKVLDEIWGNKGYDRFYILTKQAQRLPQFSPFPDNAWVGVTATNDDMFQEGLWQLQRIQATKVFISLEPFLAPIKDKMLWRSRLDLLIIGACTGTIEDIKQVIYDHKELIPMPWGREWTAQPKIEWVKEIVEAADRAGIPVFLKDNL